MGDGYINHDFPMKDVSRATSAAPTYFEPAKVLTEEHINYYALIDGGVFANNPAMLGYVEARSDCINDDTILVVSLGAADVARATSFIGKS